MPAFYPRFDWPFGFRRKADHVEVVDLEDRLITIIPDTIWCSLIAAVSSGGENTESFAAAVEFHGVKNESDPGTRR